MRTSDGYVVPIDDEAYMVELANNLAADGIFAGFVDTGSRVVPVGRVEWYAKLDARAARRSVSVTTVTTDAEALPDPTGNAIFAVFELLTSKEAGQRSDVRADRVVLPVRLVDPAETMKAAAPTTADASKRLANLRQVEKKSRADLTQELKDKATPDLPGMAITGGVVLVAVVAVVALFLFLRR
jgi:hypothetical protein